MNLAFDRQSDRRHDQLEPIEQDPGALWNHAFEFHRRLGADRFFDQTGKRHFRFGQDDLTPYVRRQGRPGQHHGAVDQTIDHPGWNGLQGQQLGHMLRIALDTNQEILKGAATAPRDAPTDLQGQIAQMSRHLIELSPAVRQHEPALQRRQPLGQQRIGQTDTLNGNLSPGKSDATRLIERADHTKRGSSITFDLTRSGQHTR